MVLGLLAPFAREVEARIDGLTGKIERRIQRATDEAKQAAGAAAITAALAVCAGLTAIMALGVALFALYRWVAATYGEFEGYGVVAGALIIVTIILAVTIIVRSKSPRPGEVPTGRPAAATAAWEQASAVPRAEQPAAMKFSAPPPAAPPPPSGGSDLAEALTNILAGIIKVPETGNEVLDEIARIVRARAQSGGQEALDSAVNIVREGHRTNLMAVLSGFVVFGWLLSRAARKR
jgi:Putative Actinobacterial Holin-X, holin superfamily III